MNSESPELNGQDAVKADVYAFSGFTFDTRERLLRRDGETVAMPPKTCELLAVLLEDHGRLLSKEELLERVWADTYVDEGNLSHHIAVLRKRLGENGNGSKFIETVARRGYQFVAPVELKNRNGIGEFRHTEIVFHERIIERRTDDVEIVTRPDPVLALPTNAQRRGLGLAVAVVLITGLTIAGLAYVSLRSDAESTRRSGDVTYTRVSDGKKVEATTISPDGKFVAYVENYYSADDSFLVVRQLGTNRELRLTEPDGRKFGIVDFSPDSSLIYFSAYPKDSAKGALYSVPILGGTPRQLLVLDPGEAGFAISPDGKRGAFFRRDEANRSTDLAIASLDGSGTQEEKLLVQPDSSDRFFSGFVAWSPDSQYLVLRNTPERSVNLDLTPRSKLFRYDIKSGSISEMFDKTFLLIGKMRFDGSGKTLYFIGNTSDRGQKIYALDIPTGELSTVTNDAQNYYNFGLGVTEDGRTIAADMLDSRADLWQLSADGDMSSSKRLKGGESNGRSGIVVFPDNRIAYIAKIGEKPDIWILSADGSTVEPLTQDDFIETGLVSTRDRKTLVFSSDRAGGRHLFRMNSDGSGMRQLTFGESINSQPDISPADNSIVYVCEENGVTSLRKVPLDGGEPVVVVDKKVYRPTFSPDGQFLAAKQIPASRSQHSTLLVFNALESSAAPREIPVLDFEYVNTTLPMSWSPDGRSIDFISERAGAGNLWRIDIQPDAAPRRLTNFTNDSIFNFNYSPDGKTIVLSRGIRQTNATLITGF